MQEWLLSELSSNLTTLAPSRYGCYVARAVVEHPKTQREAHGRCLRLGRFSGFGVAFGVRWIPVIAAFKPGGHGAGHRLRPGVAAPRLYVVAGFRIPLALASKRKIWGALCGPPTKLPL